MNREYATIRAMMSIRIPGDETEPFSVHVVSAIAAASVFVLASVTILTHAAQLLGMPFRTYAVLCALAALIVLAAVILQARGGMRRPKPMDHLTLWIVIAIALASGLLGVSMHRVGRISPDEYYYAANPVYYTQHPDAPMGFTDRLFYSRATHETAGFYTAGAFEYAEAAVASLARVRFATVFYLLGAGTTAFLIPLAIFLAIFWLSGTPAGSALGAFVTVLGITLMGETSWAPGANSFLRAFEGKAFLQFVGVPLLTAFSLRYFVRRNFSSWLALFGLGVAMTGSSTTSFALAPLLGLVLCGATVIAFWRSPATDRVPVKAFALYFVALAYVGVWALFVAWHDGIRTATFLNQAYPATFGGYLSAFVYAPFPLTPALAIAACVLAVALARGRLRILLAAWLALDVLLVLNRFRPGYCWDMSAVSTTVSSIFCRSRFRWVCAQPTCMAGTRYFLQAHVRACIGSRSRAGGGSRAGRSGFHLPPAVVSISATPYTTTTSPGRLPFSRRLHPGPCWLRTRSPARSPCWIWITRRCWLVPICWISTCAARVMPPMPSCVSTPSCCWMEAWCPPIRSSACSRTIQRFGLSSWKSPYTRISRAKLDPVLTAHGSRAPGCPFPHWSSIPAEDERAGLRAA